MKINVMKFGGSSLTTPEFRKKVAQRVIAAKKDGYDVVVVVSAIGRKPDPYATDTIIGLLEGDFPDINLRDKDLLMSCGEIISTVVMAHNIKALGVDALALTGPQAGIITDDNFGEARILEITPDKILEGLNAGKIVVVAGFQGETTGHEITTLGRGGSDTTAAALGVALRAEMVEIYTDVEGIATADPRMVPEARIIDSITYREICEMAHLGAKVIHPRAVEIAMEGRIPIKIKSTFTDAPGTLICDGNSTVDSISILGDKVVTGIAHISNLSQVRIVSGKDMNETGEVMKVFRSLANAGISVDLINVSPNEIQFTIKESDSDRARKVLEGLNLDHDVPNGFGKVSAVGAGMRGVPGVMATIVESLGKCGVKIYQTADSHTSISCLVKSDDLRKAMAALHNTFGLSEPLEDGGGVD